MKTKLLVSVFVMFLFTCISAFAQDEKDGWIKLATKTVNFKSETDVVKPSKSEADISKIKIKCIQGTVKIKDVVVVMEDGKEGSPALVGVLSKGQSSRGIDLPGKESKLKEIRFQYDSMGKVVVSKRAKIEVWGKKR